MDPLGDRVKALKQVGDTSLYVAGFFAESLTRSLVDVDYYVGLGQNAYAQLSRQLSASRSMTEVYAELSDQFPRFVDVLAQVRKRIAIVELNATTDITRLYEIWLLDLGTSGWRRSSRPQGVLVDLGIQRSSSSAGAPPARHRGALPDRDRSGSSTTS